MNPVATWEQSVNADSGIGLGTIARIDSEGVPWIRRRDGTLAAAQFTTAVTPAMLRRSAAEETAVVLAFPADHARAPIIIGVVATAPDPVEVRIDGRRIELVGDEEVTLRCGKASITLTRAGKILLRGAYVSSRSSGVNRIKGGSVQIN